MNKNILGGILIVLVLIGGGILYSMAKNTTPSTTATTTPVVVQNNTNTQTTSTAGVPIVITNSSAFPADTTVVVTGSVNPQGVFTNYWYEYGVTSNLGNKTAAQSIGSGFTSIKAPTYVTGLTKNTTYYFRLVAENSYGRSNGNQYTFRTTEGVSSPVGSAPTTKTLSATGVSRTTANINGEVTPNKNATEYWFEYGNTPDLGNTSAFSSIGDGTSKTSASISLSGLTPLTTYYFRLNAQNQFGTINGAILNFKTLGPATVNVSSPKVVTQNATAITKSASTLHGTINPNNAPSTYWFEYSTDSLLGSVLVSTTEQTLVDTSGNTTSVKADISGLIPNTTYYFRLVGQNSSGTVRGDKLTFKTKN